MGVYSRKNKTRGNCCGGKERVQQNAELVQDVGYLWEAREM